MNAYLVEYLGTLFLVFIIFSTNNYIAIGSALAIAVLLGGPISGGSFNPAVTLAMIYSGRLNNNELIPYMFSEFLGAFTAIYLIKNMVNRPA